MFRISGIIRMFRISGIIRMIRILRISGVFRISIHSYHSFILVILDMICSLQIIMALNRGG